MIAPATRAMAPVSRATRAPAGMTRSAVIAAVITTIMRVFMSPAMSKIAIGAAQLSKQSIPNRQPWRQAEMTLLETSVGAQR